MLSIIQVTTTCDDEQKAEALARALVERRLAACVQIDGPIKSVYRWNGKVEIGQEWRCTIKTKKEHLLELQHAIKSLHDYEVPQMLMTDLSVVEEAYGSWLLSEVDSSHEPPQ